MRRSVAENGKSLQVASRSAFGFLTSGLALGGIVVFEKLTDDFFAVGVGALRMNVRLADAIEHRLGAVGKRRGVLAVGGVLERRRGDGFIRGRHGGFDDR